MKGKGFNPGRRQRKIETRLTLKKADAGRRALLEARLEKLKLQDAARDIIKIYDLPANNQCKSILRLELQRGFLQGLAKKLAAGKQRLGFREQACLGLITDASKIQLTLWKKKSGSIPLKQACEMYEGAARILKNMYRFANGDKELMKHFGKEGRNVAKTAVELRQEVNRGNAGSVKPESPKELMQIAEASEELVGCFFDNLPEYVQTGFERINQIVESELKN